MKIDVFRDRLQQMHKAAVKDRLYWAARRNIAEAQDWADAYAARAEALRNVIILASTLED